MADVEDPVALAAKLPLPDRVVHKVWKVRESAYRELGDKFSSALEESKVYSDYVSLLPKIVRDANAAAQLVGLETTIKFAESAPPALVRRVAAEIGKAIVEKGLNGRPVNKQRASDTILMFVGSDAGDAVLDSIANFGFSHKTPKVVTAAIDATRESLVTYGPRAVPAKIIVSALCPLFAHSSEPVRKSSKLLAVELHRWVGDSVRGILKSAPEVTVKELELSFNKNTSEPAPQPLKLTRAMENRARVISQMADEDNEDGLAEDFSAENDDIDLAEEVDLLPKLGKMKFEVDEGMMKDWYSAVEAKKWNVRRDALNAALDIIGDGRLAPGNYSEVIVRLRKILGKDSNVNVVSNAAKLVGALAQGLRVNFPTTAAKLFTADLLGCLKEKHRSVTEAVCKSLDLLHMKRCIQLWDLGDEITVAATSKVPKVRCESFKWLERCFREGISVANMKGPPLKLFCNLLVGGTEDSSSDVRDAALAAIAALYVIMGERSMKPFLEKLDKLRTDKIASLVKDLPIPKRLAPAGKDAKHSGKGRVGIGTAVQGCDDAVSMPLEQPSTVRKSPPRLTVSEIESRNNAEGDCLASQESDDEAESSVDVSNALSLAHACCNDFDSEHWVSKSSKARAAASNVLCTHFREKSALDSNEVDVILSILSVPPGMEDSNFMAFKTKLELLGIVAEKASSRLPRGTLKALVENCIEHLGDIKCAVVATDVLMTIAEATSPRYFFDILSTRTQITTNARAKVGMTKFVQSFIQDFGIKEISLHEAQKLIASLLHEPPPALRTAAVSLGGAVAARSDFESLKKILETQNVDEQIIALVDTECAKHGKALEPPCRKRRFDRGGTGSQQGKPNINACEMLSSEVTEDADNSICTSRSNARNGACIFDEQEKELDDQVSGKKEQVRINVSEKFAAGSVILVGLRDPNWKLRQNALASINDVIANANSCISGNIGSELMPALRARLNDSNRNIAASAYATVGRLGHAMGRDALPHVKTIMSPVLGSGCVDIKKQVRDSAMSCLNLWFEAVGLSPLISFLGAPLASLNSGFRRDYLEWLAPRLSGSIGEFVPSAEDLSPLVDPCLSCLRDRTAEVRQLSEAVLESIVTSVGFNAVDGKVVNLSKSARLQLEPVLAKYRGNQSLAADGASSRAASSQNTANRERPRSMASPRVVGSQQLRVDERGTATPRSGLRRARPVSLKPPQAVPMQDITRDLVGPSHGRIHSDSNALARINAGILSAGAGRDVRAERLRNRRKESQLNSGVCDGVAGVWDHIPEGADDLAYDLQECVTKDVLNYLMGPANRFMNHAEAIELIESVMRQDPDSLVACADVLLRWAVFRIDDIRTPPTMLIKAADFISSICEVLLSSGFMFDDYEASAILPVLVAKCGSNRSNVRDAMLSALLSVGDVMETGMLVSYLVDCMWRTDASQAKLAISSQLPPIFDRLFSSKAEFAPNVFSVLARVAYGPDDAAGRAAAVCIDHAHQHIGEGIWAMIGEVTDDQAELLESRFAEIISSGDTSTDEVSIAHRDVVIEASKSSPRPVVEKPGHISSSTPQHTTASTDPGIRAEDFRLSIAPNPPNHVMSIINGGEITRTPAGSRSVGFVGNVASETPALPVRRPQPRRDYSFISVQQNSVVQAVLELVACDSTEDQMQGLDILFDDVRQGRRFAHDHVGEVVPALSHSFRNCVARFENGTASNEEYALLKKYLSALMIFTRDRNIILKLEQNVIEQLIGDFLDALIPEDVTAADDWERFRRGVNLGIISILETCDRNLLFAALFNLLLTEAKTKNNTEESHGVKFQLLTKAVAKVAKRGFRDMSVDALFRDLSLFLTSVRSPRGQGASVALDEESLRLVRTIVDAIISDYGTGVYGELELVPCKESCAVVSYIKKVLAPPPLKSNHTAESDKLAEIPSEEVIGGDNSDKNCVSNAAASKNVVDGDSHEKLPQIFAQLVNSGGNDAGLRSLRAFMMCYPEIDIAPHVNKCSSSFQERIRDGLRAIEAESSVVELKSAINTSNTVSGVDCYDEIEKQESRSSSKSATPRVINSTSGNVAETETTGQAYLRRLREIQLRYCLSESEKANPTQGMSPSINSTSNSTSYLAGSDSHQTEIFSNDENNLGVFSSISVAETRDKATALRERMARIREASAD